MKHYVVSLPEGVFAIPYQPVTEHVRIEGSGWDTQEWNDVDAEAQVRDDIVSTLTEEYGLSDFDPRSISIVDIDDIDEFTVINIEEEAP